MAKTVEQKIASLERQICCLREQISEIEDGGGSVGTLQGVTNNGNETTLDIEITSSAKGLILKSPNDTRYRITVNNDGSLTTTSI